MEDGPLCSIPVSSIFKKKTIVKKNDEVKTSSITQQSDSRKKSLVVTRPPSTAMPSRDCMRVPGRNVKETEV
jgi:hypothetical protein